MEPGTRAPAWRFNRTIALNHIRYLVTLGMRGSWKPFAAVPQINRNGCPEASHLQTSIDRGATQAGASDHRE